MGQAAASAARTVQISEPHWTADLGVGGAVLSAAPPVLGSALWGAPISAGSEPRRAPSGRAWTATSQG
eukprot:9412003-Alexandrium_andersonii.AAC.1